MRIDIFKLLGGGDHKVFLAARADSHVVVFDSVADSVTAAVLSIVVGS